MALRDLFEEHGGGWLQDVALLDRLTTEKLSAKAEKVAAEGWKWTEVTIDFQYGHANHLLRLDGVQTQLTDDEQAAFDALTFERARFESEYEEFPAKGETSPSYGTVPTIPASAPSSLLPAISRRTMMPSSHCRNGS
jgi:hypothetical protein